MQLNSPNVLTKWPLASVVKEEKIVVSRSCAVGLSEDQRQPWRGEVHFLNCETLDVKYDFSVADSIVLESGCVFYILGCCFPKEWGEHSIFLSNHLIVLLFKKKKQLPAFALGQGTWVPEEQQGVRATDILPSRVRSESVRCTGRGWGVSGLDTPCWLLAWDPGASPSPQTPAPASRHPGPEGQGSLEARRCGRIAITIIITIAISITIFASCSPQGLFQVPQVLGQQLSIVRSDAIPAPGLTTQLLYFAFSVLRVITFSGFLF